MRRNLKLCMLRSKCKTMLSTTKCTIKCNKQNVTNVKQQVKSMNKFLNINIYIFLGRTTKPAPNTLSQVHNKNKNDSSGKQVSTTNGPVNKVQ